MRRIYSTFLPVTIFLLLLGKSAGAADATTLLERMSQAAHNMNYAGTFVYMQQGRLETLRLIHGVDESGERERLVTLSGKNREVIRQQGKVTCYLPKNETLVADHPETVIGFPIELPAHWEKLTAVYDFKVVGTSRVAGLEAQQIAIIPKDQLRYGQNYWVEKDSGLLLRAEIVNELGEIVEQLEFTSLELLPAITEEMFQPELDSLPQTVRNSQTKELAQPSIPLTHWQVDDLPAGFSLELQRQHVLADEKQTVEHLVYSDGLSSVSVFIEPREELDKATRTSRRGSVNIFSRTEPALRITVLGEVPMATVTQIGQSLEPLGH